MQGTPHLPPAGLEDALYYAALSDSKTPGSGAVIVTSGAPRPQTSNTSVTDALSLAVLAICHARWLCSRCRAPATHTVAPQHAPGCGAGNQVAC